MTLEHLFFKNYRSKGSTTKAKVKSAEGSTYPDCNSPSTIPGKKEKKGGTENQSDNGKDNHLLLVHQRSQRSIVEHTAS